MSAMAAEVGVSAARRAGQQASYVARNAKLAPGDRAYQPILLAEFLAAVVIVAVFPVVTGGSDNAKAKGGLSPYDTGDLKQLVAVGAVYFVLALASSGNSGRLSAWLGGLILIAIGLSKVGHGGISAVFTPVTSKTGVGKYGETAGGAV